MKVLHITNWYYSKEKPFKVPFIKEHFDALDQYCNNELIHLEVVSNNSSLFKIQKDQLNTNEQAYIVKSYFAKLWPIKEWLSTQLLKRVLSKNNANENYDKINIHTAYPLCTFTKGLLKSITIPIVFTEHWTAFHFNFNLPKNTSKLDRIKNIYHHNIPVITVSKALNNDIETFSGTKKYSNYVVPNVVDSSIFNFREFRDNTAPQFFILNNWRTIKSPFIIFEAFKEFVKTNANAILKVGGYGSLWDEMNRYFEENDLQKHIFLLGYLTKEIAAKEMQESTAFLHAASYETFSVVTAEALMRGTPVIISNIPAVSEFVNDENGLLVENQLKQWQIALNNITINNNKYDRATISRKTAKKFSKESVRRRYFNVLGINNFSKSLFKKINNGMAVGNNIEKPHLVNNESIIRFGMIARGSLDKGWKVLIETFNEIVSDGIENIELYLYADGDIVPKLMKRYNKTEKLKFLGTAWQPLDEIKKFDIGLLPTLHEEMPFTIIEYLSLFTTVIATDVGAISDMFKTPQGKTAGTLIPLNNKKPSKEELKKAMLYFHNNRDSIKKYKKLASQAFNKFDIRKTAKEYLKLYENAISI